MEARNNMPLAKLPTKQAAAHVGLTVPTLLRKPRRGEIGYEKLGHRTIYFYEAELQDVELVSIPYKLPPHRTILTPTDFNSRKSETKTRPTN